MTATLCEGSARADCQWLIGQFHYTKSVPSGKSRYFTVGDTIVVFSIPANPYISRWLLGEPNKVWELSRLWAPNGHDRNALTRALSEATAAFRKSEPLVEALVSYADPNVGHTGGVYRAASWVFAGACEESRAYRGADGSIVSRRAFHSGRKSLRKAEIEALGYTELKLPGKLRFVKGLTRKSKNKIRKIGT